MKIGRGVHKRRESTANMVGNRDVHLNSEGHNGDQAQSGTAPPLGPRSPKKEWKRRMLDAIGTKD